MIFKDRLEERSYTQSLVLKFFKNDSFKTSAWYVAPNPLLENLAPFEMEQAGQETKLREFVECRLKGNSS